MKFTYDTYGMVAQDLGSACAMVEQALNITMVHRTSDYVGDYDQFPFEGGGQIKLQSNRLEHEEEDAWMEPKYKDFPFILYVSETYIHIEIEAALAGVAKLLERKEL